MSDLLFAPAPTAVANLEAEPAVRGSIHLTGNTGVDALLQEVAGLHPRLPLATRRKQILVTCHRRENRGEPMRRVAEACLTLVRDLPVEITIPLHTSPIVRTAMKRLLDGHAHIRLIEPLGYAGMVAALANCWLVLTDSGGVQEEAPTLGRPLLVLRDVTERNEAVLGSNAELVGTDVKRIVTAVSRLIVDEARYAGMSIPSRAFGDGQASQRIVAAIAAFFDARTPERYRRSPLALPLLA